MVARLGPRVGEEHPDAGQRPRRQHVFQHVDAVAADQPHVGQARPVDAAEQLCEPATVDLDGDDVEVRFGGGHRQGRDSGTAADLQHHRCRPAEPRLGVQFAGGSAVGVPGLHAEFGPASFPGLLLTARERRTPGPEAGDRVGRGAQGRGRLSGLLALGMHPSIVAHQGRCTRIVVQIDTQQLPSARIVPVPRKSPLGTSSPRCDDGLGVSRVMPISKPNVPTMFDERLTRFAETAPMPRLSPIIARLRRPVRVAVSVDPEWAATRWQAHSGATGWTSWPRRRRRGPGTGDRRGAQAGGAGDGRQWTAHAHRAEQGRPDRITVRRRTAERAPPGGRRAATDRDSDRRHGRPAGRRRPRSTTNWWMRCARWCARPPTWPPSTRSAAAEHAVEPRRAGRVCSTGSTGSASRTRCSRWPTAPTRRPSPRTCAR